MTCWGRLFQVWAAATGKVRSPTVDSRVQWTFSDSEEADRILKKFCKKVLVKMHKLDYNVEIAIPKKLGQNEL